MLGYLTVTEQCNCGGYSWNYESLPDGNRKTCLKCGHVDEQHWETTVSGNAGEPYQVLEMEEDNGE